LQAQEHWRDIIEMDEIPQRAVNENWPGSYGKFKQAIFASSARGYMLAKLAIVLVATALADDGVVVLTTASFNETAKATPL
jgi:hypothetical protein